jgi:nucleoside-diphosphate-sugar epimerase
MKTALPALIEDEGQLEDLLSTPDPDVVALLKRLDADLLLLGAGGKMGPSLARMARRAFDQAGRPRRVMAVSRFLNEDRGRLEALGIETIACDLLDPAAVAKLPKAPLVIAMAGRKFGSTGNEALTWAMNAWLPAVVCRQFAQSRIVAFSTGNVYGLSPAAGNGPRETDALCPVGEYAQSCLGRERMYQFFSQRERIPLALLRLNYACDLRYGVLVDLAESLLQGRPIDLAMGWFNTIWQTDANRYALLAFDAVEAPPRAVNVTGSRKLSVRAAAALLGKLLGREPVFVAQEGPKALLSDASWAIARWGPPRVSEVQLMEWVAGWVGRGGRRLGKPTHYESLDGRF